MRPSPYEEDGLPGWVGVLAVFLVAGVVTAIVAFTPREQPKKYAVQRWAPTGRMVSADITDNFMLQSGGVSYTLPNGQYRYVSGTVTVEELPNE